MDGPAWEGPASGPSNAPGSPRPSHPETQGFAVTPLLKLRGAKPGWASEPSLRGRAQSAWRIGVASRLQRAGKREALTADHTFHRDAGQFSLRPDSPAVEVAANPCSARLDTVSETRRGLFVQDLPGMLREGGSGLCPASQQRGGRAAGRSSSRHRFRLLHIHRGFLLILF